jgi:acyl transferase domain-containing protein
MMRRRDEAVSPSFVQMSSRPHQTNGIAGNRDRVAADGRCGVRLLRSAAKFVRARLSSGEHRLLFAFTGGMGPWPGLGRGLYREHGSFRDSIEAASSVVEEVIGWSPAADFREEGDARAALEDRCREILLPGLVQIALVDLWRSHGVHPGGVVSLRLGEMTASYGAGALSRSHSVRVLTMIAQGGATA